MMEIFKASAHGRLPRQFPPDTEAGKLLDKSPGIQGDTLDLSPEAEAQLRKLKQTRCRGEGPMKEPTWPLRAVMPWADPIMNTKGPDGKQYAIGGHVDISPLRVDGDPRRK